MQFSKSIVAARNGGGKGIKRIKTIAFKHLRTE